MYSSVRAVLVWLVLIGAGNMVWAEDMQPRIIGGVDAGPEESKSFAALMIKRPVIGSLSDYVWIVACGGSYIGEGLVLTAAHCVGSEDYKIWLGDPDAEFGYTTCNSSGCNAISNSPVVGDQYVGMPSTREGDLLDIRVSGQFRDILVHKNYNISPFANDIAMIRLVDSPTPEVPSVILPDNSTRLFSSLASSREDVIVIGLGDTSYNANSFVASADLQKVTVPAVTSTACKNEYPSYIDGIMVCAGFVNGSDSNGPRDSCQGDSGGPLMHNPGGGYIQYGIVSFGDGCAETYGVYTDVYGLMYWIDNVKAYWLDSIDFDWNVSFGRSDNSMNRTTNWSITNNSGSRIDLSPFNFNDLPGGFSVVSNQCGSFLENGQSCSVSFNAVFNTTGTYDGEVFFDINDKTYELKFDAVVVKPSSTSTRFSGGGGSFSPLWLLLIAPLLVFRRTRNGPLALLLFSTLGLTACSSNPFASEPPEVVFNPAITDAGLEFSVMSNGCTQENHLLLKVKGDDVEVIRTQPDMCRATPQLKRFVMPLPEQESVWHLENPVRFSNRVSREAAN